jgi:hypothetical protein
VGIFSTCGQNNTYFSFKFVFYFRKDSFKGTQWADFALVGKTIHILVFSLFFSFVKILLRGHSG